MNPKRVNPGDAADPLAGASGLNDSLAGASGLYKVVIVLDQFEQWLHAHRADQDNDLVVALRQCDGGRLQAIVMVRDDFAMAASRFMRDLETRIVEGHNFATVGLFDVDHAKNVLTKFGQAFGKLPAQAGKLSDDEQEFVSAVASGLAQDGKVVSVRLALFAEMIKGKPWVPTTLVEVGGTEGIGVNFLEETFSSRDANPQHRLHQQAAREVLNALLPEVGSDIKGHMRSHAELLEASGYAVRPSEFNDLLRVLDGELRLITPTDPEGFQTESGSDPGSKFYQLTHDYLVPSLRQWLTSKQEETRKGRAELLVAKRSSLWSASSENHHLPSWWEWANIRALTEKRKWTEPQREMMKRAGRFHAVRLTMLAVLLTLLGWAGFESYGTVRGKALVESLKTASIDGVPSIVDELLGYRRWTSDDLRALASESNSDADTRLHASLALLPTDPGQLDYFKGRLLNAKPDQVETIVALLEDHQDDIVDDLWQVAKEGNPNQLLQAASALAVYETDSRLSLREITSFRGASGDDMTSYRGASGDEITSYRGASGDNQTPFRGADGDNQWATIADRVVDTLVKENALRVAVWIKTLRPARHHLVESLGVVYRDKSGDRSQTQIDLATNVLEDYAADNVSDLTELLLDAEPKQFVALFDEFAAHGDIDLIKKSVSKGYTNYSHMQSDSDLDPIRETEGFIEIMSTGNLDLRYAAVWNTSTEFESLESHGLSPREHLGKCQAMRTNGYRLTSISAVSIHGELVTASVWHRPLIPDDEKETLARRQANATVAALRMGEAEKVWPLLRHSPDPRLRTWIIHRLSSLETSPESIVKRLIEEPDVSIRRALILIVGEYDDGPQIDHHALSASLLELFRDDPDPGIHGAAEWVLRRWGMEKEIAQIDTELGTGKVEAGRQWFVTQHGHTMVVIPGPIEFLMSSPATEKDRSSAESLHRQRIGHSFAIASKEVTVRQFQEFKRQNPSVQHFYAEKYAPEKGCPQTSVLWYEAAAYCRWLSEQEGIVEDEMCYPSVPEIKEGLKLPSDYLSRTGYRLPSEAEWEYACRSGSETSRYYGPADELLSRYAWFSELSNDRTWAVGSLKPNDTGLFDMQGNAWEWCQERYVNYGGRSTSEDREDTVSLSNSSRRVLRGGSFVHPTSNVRSAFRYFARPDDRNLSNGFRVARTYDLSP